jgi:hypothetical protein
MKRIFILLFALTVFVSHGHAIAQEAGADKTVTDLAEKFSLTPEKREQLLEERIAAQVMKDMEQQVNEAVQRQISTTDESSNVLSEQVRAELWALVVLSIVAVVSLMLVTFFIIKTEHYTAADIMNASALIMLVYGTVFLTIKAGDTHQLTGPVGVLGAIAGYLFGQASKRGGGSKEGG